MGLTDKQEAFVQALVRCGNQRRAYREAYPKSVKWKDSSVDASASKLLNENTKVLLRFEELNHKVVQSAEEKTIVTTDRLLQQLAEIGFADMRDLFDGHGNMLPPGELPDRIARCITSVETAVVGGATIYKYRLNPKDKSLALMAQILGMLQPKQADDVGDASISITPVYGRDDDG